MHETGVTQCIDFDLSAVGSPSGINSGSALNPLRFQLINIDALIPQALHSTSVMAIVYAIIASVSAIALLRAVDTRMSVAVLASATVLVGYHRFYDAQMLWLGIPGLLSSARGRMSLLLRASYLAFLIPGQTMAAMWLNSRTDGPWLLLLLRHENAACLVVWLIFAGTAIKRSECQRKRASAADSSIA